MLRETAKASSEADQFLADVINEGDLELLRRNDGQVPESLVDFLTNALQGTNNRRQWHDFGRTLGANGLGLAALAAFRRAIAESGMANEKALVYADLVALERRTGMTFAAAADHRIMCRLAGEEALAEIVPEIAEGELSVVCVRSDAAEYERLLDGFTESPLFNDPLRNPRLTKELFQDPAYLLQTGKVEDFSFFVVDTDGRPIVQCECDILGDRYMGCREAGIELVTCAPGAPLLEAAQYLAFKQLFLMAEWAGCRNVLVESSEEVAPSKPLAECLRERGHGGVKTINAWIDLSQSPEEIERGYRDAHRQSLRWGRKNLVVLSTVGGLTNEQAVELYHDVHRSAERSPGLRRDRVTQLLADGHISLYAGYYEGKAVSILTAAKHGTTTYYMASAKSRGLNKPLTHVLLHSAVLDAKAAGQKRFDFGMLHVDDRWGAKLRNIAFYKRGYTSTQECRLLHFLTV